MYTAQIEKAIQAAAVLHAEQIRKGPVPIPYVTHVFSVYTLVSEYSNDEPTCIAALLHDTLEDTDYTPDALKEDFGTEVLAIVTAVSEDKNIADWTKRKAHYLENVQAYGDAAWVVSAADKIHNMRSMIEQYHDDVPGYIANFARYRTKGQTFLNQLGEALEQHLDNKIIFEYQHVLAEFSKFNEYVKSVEDQEAA